MFTVKQVYTRRIRAVAFLVLVAACGAFASTPFAPAARAASGHPAVVTDLTSDQIEAAVQEYFDSVSAFDIPRFVSNFAPNGVLEDPVGTPPVQGTANLTSFMTSLLSSFKEIKPRIQEIIVCGHEAEVNWKLNLKTKDGKKITIDGMGVFNFNPDGKLASVREFWDLDAFLAAMQN